MKRVILSMIVFAGMLAAQPFGPGGPGVPPEGAPEPGARLAALAEVFNMEPADLAEKVKALREQQRAQMEGMRAEFQELRDLREQLKAAVEAENAAQNTAVIGELVLQIEAKQEEIKAAHEQNREAVRNIIKSWGPDAEAGLAKLEEAAELMPALAQARMILGLGADGRRGRRGKGGFGGGPMVGPGPQGFRNR